jgi:predicted ferric reductase
MMTRLATLYACIASLNAVAFAVRFAQYDTLSWWIATARGSAAACMVNLALVLLSMMRATISRFKYDAPYRRWLALDHHVVTHKLAGNAFVAWSAVRILAYAGLVASRTDVSLVPLVVWSGAAIATCLVPLWACAQTLVRWSARFELFYYTHFLFVPICLLLLGAHAPRASAATLLAPVLAYVGDRLFRFGCSFYPHQIVAWSMHPGSMILELHVPRPAHWTKTSAGDYAYLCVPHVSKLEWHPLTISSSPLDTETLTFHLRVRGNWTTQLAALLKRYQAVCRRDHPLLYLDGPLRSPASTMVSHTVSPNAALVLVASGVGVTPFLALLQQRRALRSGIDATVPITLLWHARDLDSIAWAREALVTTQIVALASLNIVLILDSIVANNATPELHPSIATVASDAFCWQTRLTELAAKHDQRTHAFYYCGPNPLAERLERIVGALPGRRWTFHKENY